MSSHRHGFAKAMAMTAWHYMAGLAVPQNDDIAKQWMQKAIEIGDEKTAEIMKKELNNYEEQKNTVIALFEVAVEMNGIPSREERR